MKLESRELYNKYSVIELDPNMLPHEKTPHMLKWCETNLEMFCKLGL